MPKEREYPFAIITDYPEAAEHLSKWLQPMGEITEIRTWPYPANETVEVSIRTHQPLKVKDWNLEAPSGAATINSDTGAVINSRPVFISVHWLPDAGDTEIKLTIHLSLDSRALNVGSHNISVLEDEIKGFAERVSQCGFCYHFKQRGKSE